MKVRVYNKIEESVEHSLLWKDNSCSDIQIISSLLLNQKIHYHVHKILPLHYILNQLNVVQIFTANLF